MKQENDPALSAIDKLKDWLGKRAGLEVNGSIVDEKVAGIRTAYLASKQQPSDGGEFERVAMRITAELWAPLQFNPDFRAPEAARYIVELTSAHNADRAADKQRISELEAAKENYKQMVVEQKQRIAELELRLGCCRDASAGKDLLIAELEDQLKKARGEA